MKNIRSIKWIVAIAAAIAGILCISCNDDSGDSSPNFENLILDTSAMKMHYSLGEKLNLSSLTV